jgi:hypothetical protein
MIIQNGTLQIKQKQAGGIDHETGHPIRSSVASYGEPIPCQYIVNTYNALGLSQGEHATLASYQVLIDEQPFTAEQLRLTDRTGKVIGDFSVIWIEPLEAVCEIRIWI